MEVLFWKEKPNIRMDIGWSKDLWGHGLVMCPQNFTVITQDPIHLIEKFQIFSRDKLFLVFIIAMVISNIVKI